MPYNPTALTDTHIVWFCGGLCDTTWRHHSTHHDINAALAQRDRLISKGYAVQIETRD